MPTDTGKGTKVLIVDDTPMVLRAVAGLGLGYQLIEISKRPQVTRLTLVEKSRSIVDWLLPVITPHLGRPLDSFRVKTGKLVGGRRNGPPSRVA